MSDFDLKSYWEERYRNQKELFEWYQNYSSLKQIIIPIFKEKKNPSILVPGCGNSKVSEDLYNEGFLNIVNIDFSDEIVQHMQKRNEQKCPKMSYQVMDITQMTFKPNEFDFILDKGAFDCLACSENTQNTIDKYLNGVKEILKPKGVFICISHCGPEQRLRYLQ